MSLESLRQKLWYFFNMYLFGHMISLWGKTLCKVGIHYTVRFITWDDEYQLYDSKFCLGCAKRIKRVMRKDV